MGGRGFANDERAVSDSTSSFDSDEAGADSEEKVKVWTASGVKKFAAELHGVGTCAVGEEVTQNQLDVLKDVLGQKPDVVGRELVRLKHAKMAGDDEVDPYAELEQLRRSDSKPSVID